MLRDRFQKISERMMLDFDEAGLGKHQGNVGQNREGILKTFLKDKLPFQYGIDTGEIVYPDGSISNQTDIILFDRMKCPLFYSNESIIAPAEGTYGIIEVKSSLGKEELRDAALKIKNYKSPIPRDLAIIHKIEHITFHRPSRPFGIVFGYQLKNNSLESLSNNWMEINKEIGVVNNWINMIVVLGEGIILIEKVLEGKEELLLDTDSLVNFTLAAMEGKNDGNIKVSIREYKEETMMWFYFYLSSLLARTSIAPVDIGKYVDAKLPPLIHKIL